MRTRGKTAALALLLLASVLLVSGCSSNEARKPEDLKHTVVYRGAEKLDGYQRPAKEQIRMPSVEEYSKVNMGIAAFRKTAFRQNAFAGHLTEPTSLSLLWKTETGSELTGQPLIVKWSVQVRELTNITEEKRNREALKEVIVAGADGTLSFLDLEDGEPTRDPVSFGASMNGTPAQHPMGEPYLSVGLQSGEDGKAALRHFNLYNQEEFTPAGAQAGTIGQGQAGSFEQSSLIDRISDSEITLGSNGVLYLTSLGSYFDYKAGRLEITPETVAMAAGAMEAEDDSPAPAESAHAMYDKYVFYADTEGILRCVDTDSLTVVWAAETGDAVCAAVALDQGDSGALDLYTANMLRNRRNGSCQIRRYDALEGKEIWCAEIGVAKEPGEDAGAKASPVIGQDKLDSLVFFTLTGLNGEGCRKLGISGNAKAALIALEKETGAVRWARELSSRSGSSPVAVYDGDGNGWIVQCAEDGTVLLLAGETGEEQASLQMEGTIKASPAVYNNILVIGAAGEETDYVCGVLLGNEEQPGRKAEAGKAVLKDQERGNRMVYNRILVIAFIAWLGSQLSKTIIYWIINRKFVVERMFGDGGMPSSHSAIVASVVTTAGLMCGWDSPLFAIAAVLALIVMHDAMGVRQETGKQAKVINNMIQLFESMGRGELKPDEALKEFVGHTGRQVIVGALLGILTAVVMNMILP